MHEIADGTKFYIVMHIYTHIYVYACIYYMLENMAYILSMLSYKE